MMNIKKKKNQKKNINSQLNKLKIHHKKSLEQYKIRRRKLLANTTSNNSSNNTFLSQNTILMSDTFHQKNIELNNELNNVLNIIQNDLNQTSTTIIDDDIPDNIHQLLFHYYKQPLQLIYNFYYTQYCQHHIQTFDQLNHDVPIKKKITSSACNKFINEFLLTKVLITSKQMKLIIKNIIIKYGEKNAGKYQHLTFNHFLYIIWALIGQIEKNGKMTLLPDYATLITWRIPNNKQDHDDHDDDDDDDDEAKKKKKEKEEKDDLNDLDDTKYPNTRSLDINEVKCLAFLQLLKRNACQAHIFPSGAKVWKISNKHPYKAVNYNYKKFFSPIVNSNYSTDLTEESLSKLANNNLNHHIEYHPYNTQFKARPLPKTTFEPDIKRRLFKKKKKYH